MAYVVVRRVERAKLMITSTLERLMDSTGTRILRPVAFHQILPPRRRHEPRGLALHIDWGCRTRVRGGGRKPWGVGRAFQRGEIYVGFAWNFRVMIYTSDVSVRDAA